MTEADAFKADVKLADLRARAEAGELTDDEQATLDLLTGPLPEEFKAIPHNPCASDAQAAGCAVLP